MRQRQATLANAVSLTFSDDRSTLAEHHKDMWPRGFCFGPYLNRYAVTCMRRLINKVTPSAFCIIHSSIPRSPRSTWPQRIQSDGDVPFRSAFSFSGAHDQKEKRQNGITNSNITPNAPRHVTRSRKPAVDGRPHCTVRTVLPYCIIIAPVSPRY